MGQIDIIRICRRLRRLRHHRHCRCCYWQWCYSFVCAILLLILKSQAKWKMPNVLFINYSLLCSFVYWNSFRKYAALILIAFDMIPGKSNCCAGTKLRSRCRCKCAAESHEGVRHRRGCTHQHYLQTLKRAATSMCSTQEFISKHICSELIIVSYFYPTDHPTQL